MEKYIEIGKITNTHALKGELKMIYWCDAPDFLINIPYLFLDDEGKKKIKIQHSRIHKNFFIMKVEGIDDISQTTNLINKVLYIPRNEIKLNAGEYFQQDLIDVDVIDVDTNENYGKIFKITKTGANDVYYIKDENKRELLIPAIKDVIKKVDIENKVMLIKPLDGLFNI